MLVLVRFRIPTVLSESRKKKKKQRTQSDFEGEYVKRRVICLVSNAARLSPSPIHLNQQPYHAADSLQHCYTPAGDDCECKSEGKKTTKSYGINLNSMCIMHANVAF